VPSAAKIFQNFFTVKYCQPMPTRAKRNHRRFSRIFAVDSIYSTLLN
jgi:hypothetical protein